jgi:hypothetical protein
MFFIDACTFFPIAMSIVVGMGVVSHWIELLTQDRSFNGL